MPAILEHLQQLRRLRRQTVQALQAIGEAQLTAHVGPQRSADVRATLLRMAQDDDRRRVSVDATFAALGWRPPEGARILASVALTRGHMRAALVGLTDEQVNRPPNPDEWAVRQALQHVMNNENRFIGDARYAVERLRSVESLPLERPGEPRGPGTLGPEVPGGLEDLLQAVEQVRDELVATTASFTDEELAAPMVWAGTSVDVRFMLHRRATHEREHTAQISKTLRTIGRHPSEAETILGQAEIARAALEGTLLGIPDDVLARAPGDGLPTIAQLLSEARAEEEAKVGAILGAIS